MTSKELKREYLSVQLKFGVLPAKKLITFNASVVSTPADSLTNIPIPPLPPYPHQPIHPHTHSPTFKPLSHQLPRVIQKHSDKIHECRFWRVRYNCVSCKRGGSYFCSLCRCQICPRDTSKNKIKYVSGNISAIY